MSIDITKFSLEEKKEIRRQIIAEENAKKQKIADTKVAYKELAEEFVIGKIDELVHHNEITEFLLTKTMQDFHKVKELKQEVYGVKEQDSHTVTLKDGSASISLGQNVTIKFDGTETAGVEKIRDYLKSLASEGEDAKKLAKALDTKLKVNTKTGFLNPSSIIELNGLRDEFNSDLFSEGLDIVVKAQIRTVNSMYVSGWKYVMVDDIKKKLEFRFTI